MAANTTLNRVKGGRIYKAYRNVKDTFTSLFKSKPKPEMEVPSFNLMRGSSITFTNASVPSRITIAETPTNIATEETPTDIATEEAPTNIATEEIPTKIAFGCYNILIYGQQLFPSVKACQRLDGRLHLEVGMSETNDDNYEKIKVSSTNSGFLNKIKSQVFEFGPKKQIIIEMPSSLPKDAVHLIGPVSGTLIITGVAMPAEDSQENVVEPTLEPEGQGNIAETNAEPESQGNNAEENAEPETGMTDN